MSLQKQLDARMNTALMNRLKAAMYRHAVFLVTKVDPTTAEIAWRDAALGMQYADVTFIGRCEVFACATPGIYEASDLNTITDEVLLAIVPDMPVAIKP